MGYTGRGPNVLIVDDDDLLREPLAEAVELLGFHVIGARHGGEALEQLHRDSRIEIILLDWNMPFMDGRTFRVAQMQAPCWAGIPVVVMSASEEAEEEALRLGVHCFLPKPVCIERLLAAMQCALPIQSSEAFSLEWGHRCSARSGSRSL